MFYQSAVRQTSRGISFIGRLIVNGQLTDVDLIPSSAYPWYISYRLAKNFVNPVTGRVIQPGDDIEIGIDPTTATTLRTKVIQTAMNDYTVQIQGYNAGYYVDAPYSLLCNCNYTVGARSGLTDTRNTCYTASTSDGLITYTYDKINDPNAVPDYYNLVTYFSFSYGFFYAYYPVDPFTCPQFHFKIISSSPIAASNVSAGAATGYWGKFNRITNKAANATLQPMIRLTQQMYPVVTFDGTVTCENFKTLKIKPTYDYYIPCPGGLGSLKAANGLWSTRGFPPGYNMVAQRLHR